MSKLDSIIVPKEPKKRGRHLNASKLLDMVGNMITEGDKVARMYQDGSMGTSIVTKVEGVKVYLDNSPNPTRNLKRVVVLKEA